jgi:hypothetical protein
MPTESISREFYDRFMADPQKTLASILSDGEPKESYWIDYKRLPVKQDDRTSPDWGALRDEWTRVICGFANTDGGVLVWGVDAPKEVPRNSCPFPDVEKVREKLEAWKTSATDKAVQGVESFAFPSPVDPSLGYIISYIPSGRNKPYRAEHDLKNYFYRAEHSFDVMSPLRLKELFYPQYSPDYKLSVFVRRLPAPEDQVELLLDFCITNLGPGSAINCSVLLASPFPCTDLTSPAEGLLTLESTECSFIRSLTNRTQITINFKSPLHPKFAKVFARGSVRTLVARLKGMSNLRFNADIYSDHAEPRSYVILITALDHALRGFGDRPLGEYKAEAVDHSVHY